MDNRSVNAKESPYEYLNSCKNFKRDVIKAAKELFYPESVIQRLEAATSKNELTRIMKNARLRDC